MDAEVPESAMTSDFEQLRPPAAATDGEPIFRGTHQYGYATVERTYYLTDGILAVETAYIDGEETLTTVDECWLLEDGGERVRHTGEDLATFCRAHHSQGRVTDIEFCLDGTAEVTAEPFSDTEVMSTFQPATTVRIEDGEALQYEGTHEAGEARIERSFFVSESHASLRVRTTYYWAGESLGSLEETEPLLDGGEFVAATGEPIDAFCRRTHLVDPDADVRYCARIGRGDVTVPPQTDDA